MHLTIFAARCWAFDEKTLSFPGLNIGPPSKRELIDQCSADKDHVRHVVRVGGHYMSMGARGSGREYVNSTIYFVENRVLVGYVDYRKGDTLQINRLIRQFIDHGEEGLYV